MVQAIIGLIIGVYIGYGIAYCMMKNGSESKKERERGIE